jgi:broad specificity phosphatase PhoE
VSGPIPDAAAGRLVVPGQLGASIVLVRHGESTYVAEGRFQGRQDAQLSTLGQRQAALVARRLADRDSGTPLPIPLGPPIGVWHSPLSRAADTARAIAAAQPGAPPLHADEHFTEIAQGEWEGIPASEVRERWPEQLAAWRRDPTRHHAPGGEPVLEAAARVRHGLATLLDALSGAADPARPAGEAASSDHLRLSPVPGYPSARTSSDEPPEPWAVLVAHDGIFRLALMSLLDVPYERFWSFPFNLAAISVVALNVGVATLRAHNLSEHLAPLAEEERAAAEARGDRRGAL